MRRWPRRGVARYLVEQDAEPPSIQDTGLRFDEIPEEVTAAQAQVGNVRLPWRHRRRPSLLRIVQQHQPQDAGRRRLSRRPRKKRPIPIPTCSAQGYRDYLLNARNTRHREEATVALPSSTTNRSTA